MLKIIGDLSFQKKMFSSIKKNNFCNLSSEDNKSKLFFNQLKTFLMKKEIKFNNIFTKSKKNKDEDVTYSNFSINNLINILNKKNFISNKNQINHFMFSKIEKKKINTSKKDAYNNMLDNFNKNLNKKPKIKKIILKKKLLSNKNKFFLYNELKKNKTMKNINFKNLHNKITINKKDTVNFEKKHIQFKENSKQLVLFTHNKSKNNNCIFLKNFHKSNQLTRYLNPLNRVEEQSYKRLHTDKLNSCFFENVLEWQKKITEKILLSISNKDHKAEISLKPESLGFIHVQIKMKKNQAILNLISDHNDVRAILESSLPFLRDSLRQNGIKLKKANVYSTFLDMNEMLEKKYKKTVYNDVHQNFQLNKFFILVKNQKNLKNYESIDVHV
ncbi:hypothetical protein D9V75_00360 [Buchnera aphidicola (Muscaphis stroyani)]|uniref:Flagellar hook-length control protein-like C-terminal domain-containing protein n=1 Tax=Buchnera aphidicola (Muscaphis stroyani) TaxID=1241869 RepID=A0A4D6YIE5_9GAMM|nr:flagellar hook-length control protein FliK [Buchnera aphidicola]QCI24185.1 hypothetical protein D9V75_00360 [Buchnera aphidicola (Muscaphis stroyani)]